MGSIRLNISNGGFRSDGPIWEDVLGSSDEQRHVVGTDGDCSIQGWKRVRTRLRHCFQSFSGLLRSWKAALFSVKSAG